MRIDQVIAIVTGGASGMGEATTRAIIEGGGKVCITCRSTARAEALVKEYGEDKCMYVQGDVSIEANAENRVHNAIICVEGGKIVRVFSLYNMF